jgi:hypothetical protein
VRLGSKVKHVLEQIALVEHDKAKHESDAEIDEVRSTATTTTCSCSTTTSSKTRRGNTLTRSLLIYRLLERAFIFNCP